MVEQHPTTNRGRALRLLAGGAAGGVVAWVVAVAAFWTVRGPGTFAAVALAGAATIVFFAGGQLVQVAFAESEPVSLMVATLASYAVRVAGLAAFAILVNARMPEVDPIVMAITMIAVVGGWVGAEIWSFVRLRIPAFDPPQGGMD